MTTTVTEEPILRLRSAKKYFAVKRGFPARVVGQVHAVEPIDLDVSRGEVLGIVGESGSGKSTMGRLALRLLEPTEGQIEFDGQDITHLSATHLRPFRRRMQMVFQNPYSSLNPRMSVEDCLSEVLLFHRLAGRKEVSDRVAELLTQVGVDPSHRKRYPRAFSGGQRQRIALARALAVQPELLVADEPVSALDVSIQAEIINLFMTLREQLSLSMLFVSHDLSVVELVSDRVLVLYLGRPMEIAPVDDLYAEPRHPYTRALLEAVPGGTARGQSVSGEIPSPVNPPSGCVFRTRCPFAVDACSREIPALREIAPGHRVACIRDDVTG